jgi:hypothetical protein
MFSPIEVMLAEACLPLPESSDREVWGGAPGERGGINILRNETNTACKKEITQ